MKVVHFTQYSGSGMHNVAESFVKAEREIGIDAHLLNIHEEESWAVALDADVHVAHTHWPDFYRGTSFRRQLKKPAKIVAVFHGTPEFIFRDTQAVWRHAARHGLGDGLQMMYHWLAQADARVTFWPRHQAIFETMVDRGTLVHCVPLGIDLDYWRSGKPTIGWPGNPSVWTGENPHIIKDPFDLITLWPWVYPQLEGASLHACYLATDLHRTFAPWLSRNGAAYGMHWSPFKFAHHSLRDIFKTVHFFIGLVRYGDFNVLSHQANAAGARTISYRGNPFSDFWITEGDQREMAAELLGILRGDTAPRVKSPVPDAKETAAAMLRIYEDTLARTIVPGFSLPFAPCKSWAPGASVIDLRTPEVKAAQDKK